MSQTLFFRKTCQRVARTWLWTCWLIYRQLTGARSWESRSSPQLSCRIVGRVFGGAASRSDGWAWESSGASRSQRLTVLLHDLQELDDDLGAGPDQDLALAGLLGVVDAVERIVEDGGADHLGGVLRFSSRGKLEMRYLKKTQVRHVSLRWHFEQESTRARGVLPLIAEEEMRIRGQAHGRSARRGLEPDLIALLRHRERRRSPGIMSQTYFWRIVTYLVGVVARGLVWWVVVVSSGLKGEKRKSSVLRGDGKLSKAVPWLCVARARAENCPKNVVRGRIAPPDSPAGGFPIHKSHAQIRPAALYPPSTNPASQNPNL